VTVRAPRDLVEVAGNVGGRRVQFWSASTPREWHGLVGVSLETGPGEQTVIVEGKSPEGAIVGGKVRLTVLRHRFRTRRLTVNATMANPPPEEAARIARDAKAISDAFATITPDRLWRGPFAAPVPGSATSSFGRLTVTNGKPAGRHQGADFRAATGTPVRAPNGGRVVIAENLYFAGNTVILDHGLGVFSLLAHLSTIDVHVGDIVRRSDVLGLSGATGRVTGPHLHWAVRFGDTSVDPLALMSAAAALPEHDTSSH
jgi:murein DD-endopeptidase MepM/ murein hydrolase activator NlpD